MSQTPPGAHEFHAVAHVDDIPDTGLLPVRLPSGLGVCVIKSGGVITAARDVCTHQAFPLSEGELEGGRLICAWHGAEFDCRDGRVQRGPAEDNLAMLDVRVGEDGMISVKAQ